MSERRKFTDSFKLGEVVSIMRTRHGWFDGGKGGPIVAISEDSCEVWSEEDGHTYTIEKPRDIRGRGEMLPAAEFTKIKAKIAKQARRCVGSR